MVYLGSFYEKKPHLYFTSGFVFDEYLRSLNTQSN